MKHMKKSSTSILTQLLQKDNSVRAPIKSLQDKEADNIAKIYGDICYDALLQIKNIVSNVTLSDCQCVEQIIKILEQLEANKKERALDSISY